MIRKGISTALFASGLLLGPGAVPAGADAGASGAVPELARALALREAGDPAAARRLVAAAGGHAAGDPAAAWEALLAGAEIDMAEGNPGAAADTARILLSLGETVFGAGAPRLSAPLVLLGQDRAVAGDRAGATTYLLRAVRLARAGHAGSLGPDGAPGGDAQPLADLGFALAALAEHELSSGDAAAAALLAAELAVLAAGPPPGLPPRWQDAAAIGGLVQLRAGRPEEAVLRALPLLQAEGPPGTDRARRLLDLFRAELAAAAAAQGDPARILAGWTGAAVSRAAADGTADLALIGALAPALDALARGDVATADASARAALMSARADDPVVTTAVLALLGATMRAGRLDLAEHWGLRVAGLPAVHVASLDADPVPMLRDLAAELTSRGAYPAAIALAEAVAVLVPLRSGPQAAPGALADLALVYTEAGRRAEAARTFDGALAALTEAMAPAGARDALAATAITLHANRALLSQDLGRFDAAATDLAAAQDLLVTTGEGQRPEAWLFVGAALRDLYLARGEPAAAERALRETLAQVVPLAGETSAPAAQAWFDLAQFLAASGRTAEAADPLRRARKAAAGLPADADLPRRIAVLEAALSGDAGGSRGLLAGMTAGAGTSTLPLAEAAANAAAAGDVAGAVAFLDAALAELDPEAPVRAYVEAGKGELLLRTGSPEAALPALRAATRALTRAERRDEPNARRHLPAHVAAALALSEATDGMTSVNHFTEAFQVAQRVDDLSAGAALGRATARLLGTGPGADQLARGLEEAERGFALARETYLATLSAGQEVTPARDALAAARTRLDTLREETRKAFPDYAALADPRPVDLLTAMRLLGPDEVLVVYATSEAPDADAPAGHVFALTSEGYMAAPLAPRARLRQIALGLRCEAALTDRHCAGAGEGTRGAFSLAPVAGPGDPGFDFALAREAWDELLAPVADALAGKSSLIVVPDRTLSAVPFHLALAEPPDAATTLRTAPWLLRSMSVTVVPSVSSLAALRNAAARPSLAERPFLGIGDPLIGVQAAGPVPYDCAAGPADDRLAATSAPAGSPILRAAGTADTAALAALSALPDTRCELWRNAALLGADSRVLIHDEATETAVKAMSAAGELARYRVLSFATHGLIAGEVGARNAGLVLTPPSRPDSGDDGLLMTSEIAALRIDAEFVILSACNTASGSSDSSEGLAGLASAFFLAGARGLLVSHWPVYSDAATDLTTGMVAALAAPDRPGRSEALRRSILSVLDDATATPRQLHPAYWAPFMVVGDGRGGQG